MSIPDNMNQTQLDFQVVFQSDENNTTLNISDQMEQFNFGQDPHHYYCIDVNNFSDVINFRVKLSENFFAQTEELILHDDLEKLEIQVKPELFNREGANNPGARLLTRNSTIYPDGDPNEKTLVGENAEKDAYDNLSRNHENFPVNSQFKNVDQTQLLDDATEAHTLIKAVASRAYMQKEWNRIIPNNNDIQAIPIGSDYALISAIDIDNHSNTDGMIDDLNVKLSNAMSRIFDFTNTNEVKVKIYNTGEEDGVMKDINVDGGDDTLKKASINLVSQALDWGVVPLEESNLGTTYMPIDFDDNPYLQNINLYLEINGKVNNSNPLNPDGVDFSGVEYDYTVGGAVPNNTQKNLVKIVIRKTITPDQVAKNATEE